MTLRARRRGAASTVNRAPSDKARSSRRSTPSSSSRKGLSVSVPRAAPPRVHSCSGPPRPQELYHQVRDNGREDDDRDDPRLQRRSPRTALVAGLPPLPAPLFAGVFLRRDDWLTLGQRDHDRPPRPWITSSAV